MFNILRDLMRYYEILSGVRMPVSGEEQELIDLISQEKRVDCGSLDERSAEVARVMVSRGLLRRVKYSDKTVFVLDDNADIWRI
jgi:hypothetical protein